jgi:hypothetical protein
MDAYAALAIHAQAQTVTLPTRIVHALYSRKHKSSWLGKMGCITTFLAVPAFSQGGVLAAYPFGSAAALDTLEVGESGNEWAEDIGDEGAWHHTAQLSRPQGQPGYGGAGEIPAALEVRFTQPREGASHPN